MERLPHLNPLGLGRFDFRPQYHLPRPKLGLPHLKLASPLVTTPIIEEANDRNETPQLVDARTISRSVVEVLETAKNSTELAPKTRKQVGTVADLASIGAKLGSLVDTLAGTRHWEVILTGVGLGAGVIAAQ